MAVAADTSLPSIPRHPESQIAMNECGHGSYQGTSSDVPTEPKENNGLYPLHMAIPPRRSDPTNITVGGSARLKTCPDTNPVVQAEWCP